MSKIVSKELGVCNIQNGIDTRNLLYFTLLYCLIFRSFAALVDMIIYYSCFFVPGGELSLEEIDIMFNTRKTVSKIGSIIVLNLIVAPKLIWGALLLKLEQFWQNFPRILEPFTFDSENVPFRSFLIVLRQSCLIPKVSWHGTRMR